MLVVNRIQIPVQHPCARRLFKPANVKFPVTMVRVNIHAEKQRAAKAAFCCQYMITALRSLCQTLVNVAQSFQP